MDTVVVEVKSLYEPGGPFLVELTDSDDSVLSGTLQLFVDDEPRPFRTLGKPMALKQEVMATNPADEMVEEGWGKPGDPSKTLVLRYTDKSGTYESMPRTIP